MVVELEEMFEKNILFCNWCLIILVLFDFSKRSIIIIIANKKK